jgi:hypothetical protein
MRGVLTSGGASSKEVIERSSPRISFAALLVNVTGPGTVAVGMAVTRMVRANSGSEHVNMRAQFAVC